jgi:plastocyanin
VASLARVVAAAAALLVLAGLAAPAWAAGQSHTVAIASFDFRPPFIQIQMGDSIGWTNLDATAHTVTADTGAFVSGSIHQGQTYTLEFNDPGVFDYFCEPHPKMRGRIIVTGAGGGVSTPTTVPPSEPAEVASAPVVAAAPRRATATTTTTSAVTTTVASPSGATPAPVAMAAPTRPAVIAGVVTGGRARLPVALVWLAVAALSAVGLAALATRLRNAPTAASAVAGALTLLAAALHLQLHYVLHYPEPVGSLMVLAAGAGALVGAYLVMTPWNRSVFLAGAAFNVAALTAFFVTRTHLGLFGYREIGWDPSPQAAVTVALELCALVALGYGFIAATVRARSALEPARPATAATR